MKLNPAIPLPVAVEMRVLATPYVFNDEGFGRKINAAGGDYEQVVPSDTYRKITVPFKPANYDLINDIFNTFSNGLNPLDLSKANTITFVLGGNCKPPIWVLEHRPLRGANPLYFCYNLFDANFIKWRGDD